MDRIRVFVADDHELVRYALRTLLEAEDDLEFVGEAAESESAVAGCVESNPDVLLLDLRMPGAAGVDVCARVRQALPGTSVLVLSGWGEEPQLPGALSVGASGYILRATRPDHVVAAIRSVAHGRAAFDSPQAEHAISGGAGHNGNDGTCVLSEREMEVLRLMAKGLSNKEIGRSLWIGETTVKTHVSHILHKLGQADRTQAVLGAVRDGLVSLDA